MLGSVEKGITLKFVHFGNVHSKLLAPVNARVHGGVLSLFYHAMAIFKQLRRFPYLLF